MVYLFLADGFEEVEAITPLDYLKRIGCNVLTIGTTTKKVVGAHNIKLLTDCEIDDLDFNFKNEDLLILPGGLKGVENLYSNKKVLNIIEKAFKIASIAAICAAPSILGRMGILKNKKVCCYPGFERYLENAQVLDEDVVVDGNIITSKGPGTAQQFTFTIIKYLFGEEKSDEIKKQVQWRL